MITSQALVRPTACLILFTIFAAVIPARAQTSTNLTSQIQQEYALLGQDAQHPYVIPFCGGAPTTISLANAGFMPHNASDPNGLDINTDFLLVDLSTPIDLTSYDNTRGIQIVDYKLPPDMPADVANVSIAGLLFTSPSNTPFDGTTLGTSSFMQMAFTVTSEANTTNNDTLYSVLISPNIRAVVPDNTTATTDVTTLQAGEYLVEIGLLIQHAAGLNVSEFTFTDMILQCLPAPSVQDLINQNITYYSNETSAGVWSNGTTTGM